MNKEKQVDVLLEALGKEMYQRRVDAFDHLDQGSKTTQKKLRSKKKNRWRRPLAWVAIICICLITLATATITSDAFRAKVFNFFFIEKSGHADMVQNDTGESALDTHVRYPEFLPNGYTLVKEEDFGSMHTLYYHNEETQDDMNITQYNDISFAKSIDTETSTRKPCIVKTYEAFYLDGNEIHVLMWEEEGVFFEIASTLDHEMMIKIADQLK